MRKSDSSPIYALSRSRPGLAGGGYGRLTASRACLIDNYSAIVMIMSRSGMDEGSTHHWNVGNGQRIGASLDESGNQPKESAAEGSGPSVLMRQSRVISYLILVVNDHYKSSRYSADLGMSDRAIVDLFHFQCFEIGTSLRIPYDSGDRSVQIESTML